MVRENGMVVMTEAEWKAKEEEIEYSTIRIRRLQNALLEATRNEETRQTDIRLTMQDFYDLADRALELSFEKQDDDNDDIYGHDVTVHWHGFYCNCQDGATAYNYIIEGVKDCLEEIDDDE